MVGQFGSWSEKRRTMGWDISVHRVGTEVRTVF